MSQSDSPDISQPPLSPQSKQPLTDHVVAPPEPLSGTEGAPEGVAEKQHEEEEQELQKEAHGKRHLDTPRRSDSGSSIGSRTQQLSVTSPTEISLDPPTPIDSPTSGDRSLPFSTRSGFAAMSSPRASHLGPSTPPVRPTPVSSNSGASNSSDNLRTRSQHRRSSSTGQHAPLKESLNAFATEREDGTKMVNSYALEEFLGQGSFAVVYRARDVQDDSLYAAKVFSKAKLKNMVKNAALRKQAAGRRRNPRAPRQPLPSPQSRTDSPESGELELGQENLNLIRKEVAIMKKVDHPNLASVHEVIDVTSADALLIVMELCGKGPIMKVVPEKVSPKLSEEESRMIFQQLVLGIAYLHHSSIVHRDIKPDNCLFMEDGKVVKIVDFGVSEILASHEDDTISRSEGSPAFMAPELLNSKHAPDEHLSGFACDVWSLGATLFTVVTGHLPFDKNASIDLINAIKDDPLVLPKELSEGLKHVLSRMLDKNPSQRITIRELWDDPWVTNDGSSPMLDYDVNCAEPISDPSEEELGDSIHPLTSTLVMTMKALSKLKRGMKGRSMDETSPNPSPKVKHATVRQNHENFCEEEDEMTRSPSASPRLGAESPVLAPNGQGQENSNGHREAQNDASNQGKASSVKSDAPICESPPVSDGEDQWHI